MVSHQVIIALAGRQKYGYKNPNYGNLSSPPEPIKAWVLSPGNQQSVASIWSQDRENDREREIFSSSGQIYSTSQTLKLTLSTCHDNLPLLNANIDFWRLFLASKNLKCPRQNARFMNFWHSLLLITSFQTFLSNMELTTDELRDRSDRIVTILDSSVTRQKSTGKPLALHDD